jgi:hypothetical protein
MESCDSARTRQRASDAIGPCQGASGNNYKTAARRAIGSFGDDFRVILRFRPPNGHSA